MSAKPHLLFDVDGTLLDTDRAMELALDSATALHGVPKIPVECIRRYSGVPGLQFLTEVGTPDPEGVFLDWRRELRKLTHLIQPFPGMVPVLERLQQAGVPMGVVTSRTADVAQADLQGLDLLRFFSEVITAEDTQGHKPGPEPILCYLERRHARPEECCYLGDTVSDCQCAHNAGVRFLLAGWGTYAQADMQEETLLHTPEELLTVAGVV